MLTELYASPKKAELSGVIAVGSLIRFFYAKLEEKLGDNPARTAEEVFAEIAKEQNEILFAMEEYYYRELRPNFPRLEAIRRIRDFLEARVK